MMRLKKSQADAPRYSEGFRTRLRDSTRRPQDERISESAKAISIETMTVLSSNTEIVQAPARPKNLAFSCRQGPAAQAEVKRQRPTPNGTTGRLGRGPWLAAATPC